jgi:5-methylcytosine-specific restriction endonuclease McrA
MRIDINKWNVLVVNKTWLVLGTTTVRNAIKSLFSTPDGNTMAAKGFVIEYEYLNDDKWNFENPIEIRPAELEEWLKLEIRPFDSYISSAHKQIRIPSVIQAQNCDKTHLRKASLSSKAILERDNYTCQYTGVQLPRNQLNIDHVISKDEWKRRGLAGSPDTWTNMVASCKNINSIKSNKSLKECGLSLIRQPKEPLPVPASSLIKEIRNSDWKIFLTK